MNEQWQQWNFLKSLVVDHEGNRIANFRAKGVRDEVCEARAAKAVLACNMHDELVAALRMVCDSGVALAEPIEKAMLAALAKAGAL